LNFPVCLARGQGLGEFRGVLAQVWINLSAVVVALMMIQ